MDSLNKNFPVAQPTATGAYEWMAVRAGGGSHTLVGSSDTDYTAVPDDDPPQKGGLSTSGGSLFGLQYLDYAPRAGISNLAGNIFPSIVNFMADTSPSGKWLNCCLQMRSVDTGIAFIPTTTLTAPGTKKVYYFEFECLAQVRGYGHSAFAKLQAGIPPGEWTLEDRDIGRDIAVTIAADGFPAPLAQEYSLPGAVCTLQLRAPNDPPEFEQYFDVTGCQVFAKMNTFNTRVNFICRVFVTGHAGTPGTNTWGTMVATTPPGIYDLNMQWKLPCPPQDGSMDNFWNFVPIP
jgi:hypothetical protein